ncbi:hypothetical protein KI387_013918, partial [Taxus chinensis]
MSKKKKKTFFALDSLWDLTALDPGSSAEEPGRIQTSQAVRCPFFRRSGSMPHTRDAQGQGPAAYLGDLVWVYKKTAQERIPTLKKYSDKAPPNDPYATREVKMDTEYKSKEDPEMIIPPERRIKGYHYGPQVVPISTIEEEALKFKPEKSLKLLCFTDTSNIP